MVYSLVFDRLIHYDNGRSGIEVDVELRLSDALRLDLRRKSTLERLFAFFPENMVKASELRLKKDFERRF